MKYEPNLSAVLDTLATKFTDALRESVKQLESKDVAHVIVGGLAVGAYGHIRNTKDVDFLVDGEAAFEHHKAGIVSLKEGMPFSYAGLPIDLLPAEEGYLKAALEDSIEDEGTGFLVINVLPLIAMKLLAGRPRDRSDVMGLIEAGIEVKDIRKFLVDNDLHRAANLFQRLIKEN